MHVVRGKEDVVMGNFLGPSKFPKNDWEKINKKLQKLPNQFVPNFKAILENQAKEHRKLSILYIFCI